MSQRALLDITQPELADAAGLGLSTIVDFEKSRRDVSRAAVHAVQKALERAEFNSLQRTVGDRASASKTKECRSEVVGGRGRDRRRTSILANSCGLSGS
jgi:transcriptional regulator with XRE-family HTH domain